MKKILFLSFSVLLFSCGGGNKNETKQGETKQDEIKISNGDELPLKGSIKEIRTMENGVSILVSLECVGNDKVDLERFSTKLKDVDGLECKPEYSGSPEPELSFDDMYKNDKISGWLYFKYPTSNYKPEKLVFSGNSGKLRFCEIKLPEQLK